MEQREPLPPHFKNYYQVLQDEQTKACCMVKNTGRKVLVIFTGMLLITTLVVGAIIADNTPTNENPDQDGLFDGLNHEKRIDAFVGAEIIPDSKSNPNPKSNPNSDAETTYAINFDELEEDYQLNIDTTFAMSCVEFEDIMWNPNSNIFKEILDLEEIFEYKWVSGDKLNGKVNLKRKMNFFMGPNQAPQTVNFKRDLNKINQPVQTLIIDVYTYDMPASDTLFARERWDFIEESPNRCKIRMAGKPVMIKSSIFKKLIVSTTLNSFKSYSTNILQVFKEHEKIVS
jgi:hypothetical protein